MVVSPSVPVEWLGALEPFGLSLSKPGRCLGAVRAEPVEAGVCWFGRRAGVEGGSRVVAPAGDSLSFASPKESKQRKGDPQSATPALRYGANLRRGDCGVRRGTRFALRAPLGQPRRVSSRSMGASTPMPPHNRPAAGAASRGWTAEHPHGPSLCSAPPAQRVALAPVRWGQAQRWPVWMSDSRVPFTMRRGAQGVGRHGRRSARASCSDSPWLSERRAQRKASSTARPTPEHRRLPAAKRRDAACRVAFSLVTFFWRSKRKPLRRRAHTPASALNPSMLVKPARQGFDKLSPNGRMLHPASTSSTRTVGLCASASTGSARTNSKRHSIATPFPAMVKNALKSIAKTAC